MDRIVQGINTTLTNYRKARAAELLLAQARAELDETLREAKAESRYSFRRLLRASGEVDLNSAPVEKGYSDELARAAGVQPRWQNSAFVGSVFARDLTVATGTQAGYLVAAGEEMTPGVPRAYTDLVGRCTTISGVNGTQQLGRFNAMPTPVVLSGESATATEATPATSRSLLAPTNAAVYVEQSRSWVVSTEMGARAVVRLLQNALRAHIAQQIILGAGTGGEVLGIVNDTAVTSASGTTVAFSTIAATVEEVERNAGSEGLAWAVTAPAAEILRQRPVISGGEAILKDGKIAGYPATIVPVTTAAHAVLGRWSDYALVEWAPIEVASNPFAGFQQGIIGVRAWATCNGAPMVNGSFACISSIT